MATTLAATYVMMPHSVVLPLDDFSDVSCFVGFGELFVLFTEQWENSAVK